MSIQLYEGDCLEIMKDLIQKGVKVNAIIGDPPYGTSACKWDKIISFDEMWKRFLPLITDDGVIALCGQEPFSSLLRCSNLQYYKYDWKWIKDNATNFLNKKFQPGKITEDVMVFGKGATSFSNGVSMKYNPQMTTGKPYRVTSDVHGRNNAVIRSNIQNVTTENNGVRLPNNVLYFNRDKQKLHPTQKPVALMEYLVKTYTNEGDLIIDPFMGSGTTGIACLHANRNFIGIEKDAHYFEVAKNRIEESETEELF